MLTFLGLDYRDASLITNQMNRIIIIYNNKKISVKKLKIRFLMDPRTFWYLYNCYARIYYQNHLAQFEIDRTIQTIRSIRY